MVLSSQNSRPRLRRMRLTRACDACSRRKIKCDAAYPRCDWCEHQGSPCTFTRRKPRQIADAIQQGAATLEERITRIENHLASTRVEDVLGDNGKKNQANVNEASLSGRRVFFSITGALCSTHLQLKCLDSSSVLIEVQQLLRSVLGRSVDLQDLFRPSPPWQRHGSEIPRPVPSIQSILNLPDIDLINEYLDAYQSLPERLSFPIIDRTLFADTTKLAYLSFTGPTTGIASARACIYAFLSLSAVWNFHGKRPLLIDSRTLMSEVERYIPQILREETIDGLQAITMLMIFHCASGNFQYALYLDSLMARLIYCLGAHISLPPNVGHVASSITSSPFRLNHHLRQLFWVAYVLDIDLSIRTGQPTALHDEVCDLTMPPGYVEQLYTLLSSENCDLVTFKCPLYPTDLRLTKIKSRAYSAFYGPGARCKSDTDLLRTIRELDNDLEEWRSLIPAKYRPSLSPSRQRTTDCPVLSMHAVIIEMDYYHCMTIIHQASGQCKSWATNKNGVVDGVGSSFALAVETSRSSLISLQSALHLLPSGIFWLLVFYPLSACLTIFCNIILTPLDPHAPQDLELLDSTTTLIKRLPIIHPPIPGVVHTERLESLVTELSRLARAVVRETQNGQSTILASYIVNE